MKGVHSDPGVCSAPGVGLRPLESTMKPPGYEYGFVLWGGVREVWGKRV